jgi:hypothetical protein
MANGKPPRGLSVLPNSSTSGADVPVRFGRELRLSDPKIFDVPILYLAARGFGCHHGYANLRRHLQNGGMLFAEACCGGGRSTWRCGATGKTLRASRCSGHRRPLWISGGSGRWG